MVVLNRRAFMAVTAVSVVGPTVIGAREVVAKGMDWMTMSLEARNLAFNNVAHVGPEFARKKTEGWAAASQALRAQRRQHLDLPYARGDLSSIRGSRDPRARGSELSGAHGIDRLTHPGV